MCEPPGNSARTTALWSAQAPIRDYPMSTPTVEKRRRGDAGVSENAPEPGTTIGESGQRGFFSSADSVEVSVDQHFDVRFRSGDGAENLPATGLRFDIADPHLEMPLPVLTTPDEGRIQGHHDCRRR